jgi:AmmeMemoRadiSam system protein B
VTGTDDVRVRPPAVAGAFYPGDPESLMSALRRCFAGALPAEDTGPLPKALPVPKALIVPHAGYVYSGPVAATAYRRLTPARSSIRHVVLLGPSHRVPLRGIAVPSADAFATPLGLVPVDGVARTLALGVPIVQIDDLAHAGEHSLEVQLPFLQFVLDEFDVLPLVAGPCPPLDVARLLDAVWGGPDTVVILSTDLSHYLRYADALAQDRRTADAVVACESQALHDRDACGVVGLRGLLEAVRSRHLSVRELDLRNSGDTAGDRLSVVGYGAFSVN